jgi:anthranilate phosphoribosyltransferase
MLYCECLEFCHKFDLLGAAVILKAAGRVPTLAEGVDAAAKSLESGAALGVLGKMRA